MGDTDGSGGGWLSGAWSLGQSMYNAAASAVNRCDRGGRWRGAGGRPAAAAGLFKREQPPGSLRRGLDLALVLPDPSKVAEAGQQPPAAASMRRGFLRPCGCSALGYEDLDVVDPTAGEAKGAEGAAPLSEVRRRRRRCHRPPGRRPSCL